MAGIAMASRPAAIAMAMPISINVMPRARIGSFLLGGGAPRRLAAVNGDVVGAALGLVRSVRIDVVPLAGADERVVHAPGILVDLADELRHQLLQAVRPIARLHMVEVDAVRDRLQVELGGLDLRFAELAEHVVADGAGDEAEDDEHHHDLDERHAARSAQAAESLGAVLHGFLYLGTKVLSCMMGIRMEKTMKATPPPIITIMTGSSRLVIAETRISTCES